MSLAKLAIVSFVLICGVIMILWMQIRVHKRKRSGAQVSFERRYRKAQSESKKDAPVIALLIVHHSSPNHANHGVSSAADKETYHSLAAHCIWSNTVATPYMSHRIVPVILKLDAIDSNVGTPSYSFCKHGRHEKCSLYQKMTKVFMRANYMDALLTTICIHCPPLSKNKTTPEKFGNQLVGMNYAVKHLEDTGVHYDYICMVSSTDCMVFGWDEMLIQQLASLQSNLQNTHLNPILSFPPQSIGKAIQIQSEMTKNLQTLTLAQVNRNNIVLNSNSAANPSASHQMAIGGDAIMSIASQSVVGDDLPIAAHLYASLCHDAKILHALPESADKTSLARLLWHCKLAGAWYGCLLHERGEIYRTVANFDMTSVGCDDSPTLTPWWTRGNTTLFTRATALQITSIFADLLSEEQPGFGDFEWSCSCVSNNLVFASPLSCYTISMMPSLTIPSVKRPLQKIDQHFCKSWINQSRVAQVIGISFQTTDSLTVDASWFSMDTPLGLLALRHADFLMQDHQAQQTCIAKFKNHDILCRFGSYAAYFAKRGSK